MKLGLCSISKKLFPHFVICLLLFLCLFVLCGGDERHGHEDRCSSTYGNSNFRLSKELLIKKKRNHKHLEETMEEFFFF